jgi:hypothetical protein
LHGAAAVCLPPLQPLTPAWQVAAMDDSPSRAEPCGENSRWKQAIIALPAGVDASDRDRYSMQFFMQVSC